MTLAEGSSLYKIKTMIIIQYRRFIDSWPWPTGASSAALLRTVYTRVPFVRFLKTKLQQPGPDCSFQLLCVTYNF